eukprot:1144916-Pelagomonas_calceolata.AAC.14
MTLGSLLWGWRLVEANSVNAGSLSCGSRGAEVAHTLLYGLTRELQHLGLDARAYVPTSAQAA